MNFVDAIKQVRKDPDYKALRLSWWTKGYLVIQNSKLFWDGYKEKLACQLFITQVNHIIDDRWEVIKIDGRK